MNRLRLVVSNPPKQVGIVLLYPFLWLSAAAYFASLICWNLLHTDDD